MSENNEINESLNKNNKVPKLRFPEFNDEWNNLRLGDILKIQNGKDQKEIEISSGVYKIYGTGGVIGYTNNFLYNKESVGIGRKGTINRPFYFNEPFWTVDTLFWSKIKANYFPKFIYYLFFTIEWNKLNQSTGLPSLTSRVIEHQKIFIPKLDEQKKIAMFFTIIDKKIDVINSKIAILKKYKEGIMIKCYELAKNPLISLSKLVKNNTILLGRGEIIPKQNGTFPVYSSSAANNGLFCFRNKYSFDEELITWSIDGGGKPFLRNKHKFSITNVCGYAKILDLNKFSYSWLYINFWNSWRKIKFDYTTKAHPSAIEKLYKIKSLDIESQMKIEKILTYINNKIDYLIKELNDVTLTKESLLRSLFF